MKVFFTINFFRLTLGLMLVTWSSLDYATESFTKYWGLLTYTGQYQDFHYMIEPQIRLIQLSKAYEQSLINMGIGHDTSFNNLQLWLGQTYVNFSPQDTFAEDTSANNLNEYRIWQQFIWAIPEKYLLFKGRLEERHSLENAPWAIRFRERTYWTLPFNNIYSLVISDEFFINIKSVPWVTTQVFDQNRLFLGVLTQVTPQLSFSLSYLNQYITRRPAEINHGVILNVFFNIKV